MDGTRGRPVGPRRKKREREETRNMNLLKILLINTAHRAVAHRLGSRDDRFERGVPRQQAEFQRGKRVRAI
jgi:hypothetical protein